MAQKLPISTTVDKSLVSRIKQYIKFNNAHSEDDLTLTGFLEEAISRHLDDKEGKIIREHLGLEDRLNHLDALIDKQEELVANSVKLNANMQILSEELSSDGVKHLLLESVGNGMKDLRKSVEQAFRKKLS